MQNSRLSAHHLSLALSTAFLIFFTGPANALPGVDSDIFHHGLTLYGGYETGGGELNNGVLAGDGVSIHLGEFVRFRTGASHMRMHLSLGYRSNDDKGENSLGGSVKTSMTVLPVDFLVHFNRGGFNIGGGVTYHLLPTYSEETALGTEEVNFNSQLGYVLSVEFVGHREFMLGMRYNYIKYTPEDGSFTRGDTGETLQEIDGSNVGIYIGLYL